MDTLVEEVRKALDEEIRLFSPYFENSPTIAKGIFMGDEEIESSDEVEYDQGDDDEDLEDDEDDDSDDAGDGLDESSEIDSGRIRSRAPAQPRRSVDVREFPNFKKLYADIGISVEKQMKAILEAYPNGVEACFPNLLWSTSVPVPRPLKVFPGTTCPISRYFVMKSPRQHQSRDRLLRVQARAPGRSNRTLDSVDREGQQRRNIDAEIWITACCTKVWRSKEDGDLVLCFACKAWFHFRCQGLQDRPKARWHCPGCDTSPPPKPKKVSAPKRPRLEPGARKPKSPQRMDL